MRNTRLRHISHWHTPGGSMEIQKELMRLLYPCNFLPEMEIPESKEHPVLQSTHDKKTILQVLVFPRFFFLLRCGCSSNGKLNSRFGSLRTLRTVMHAPVFPLNRKIVMKRQGRNEGVKVSVTEFRFLTTTTDNHE